MGLFKGGRRARRAAAPPPSYAGLPPRHMTSAEVDELLGAAEHRLDTVTVTEIMFLCAHLRKTDYFRVRHIQKDLAWLYKKAEQHGLGWQEPIR